MRAITIPTETGVGKVLYTTIFRSTGRKLLAKGHALGEEDVKLLQYEGLTEIWVVELEPGEVAEDDAVWQVAGAASHGAIELKAAAGGRVNVFARETGALLVNPEVLLQVNTSGSIVMSTLPPFSLVTQGERVASIKSRPFAVRQACLSEILRQLDTELLRVKPIRQAKVGILMTDPLDPDRAVEQFWQVTRQRIEAIAGSTCFYTRSLEEDEALVRSLLHLRRSKPTVILVASTTAPAGPEDAVGRAMLAVGGRVERFLAPVEPGNLGLLAYWDDVPVLSAPGCFRSGKPNLLSLMLPPLLAGHPLSSREIATMGAGGLLGN